MSNTLSINDFPDFIQKGFVKNEVFDLEKASQIIESNFEKGLISEDLFCDSMDILEKGGKRASVGEIREFGGRKYIKTATGWKFYGAGKGKKAAEHHASSTKKEENSLSSSTKKEEAPSSSNKEFDSYQDLTDNELNQRKRYYSKIFEEKGSKGMSHSEFSNMRKIDKEIERRSTPRDIASFLSGSSRRNRTKSSNTPKKENKVKDNATDKVDTTKENKKGDLDIKGMIREFKIPKTSWKQVFNHKGRYVGEDTYHLADDTAFFSQMKKYVDKYGDPVKVEKKDFSTYNKEADREHSYNQNDYEYEEGEYVEVTFKGKDGDQIKINNFPF